MGRLFGGSRSLMLGAVLGTVAASPALADLTAAQAWERYRDILISTGAEVVSARPTARPGAVEVRDLTVRLATPEVTSVYTISRTLFSENPDGTVAVVQSPDYAVSHVMPAEEVTFRTPVFQQGLSITLSGSPENTLMVQRAETMRVELVDLAIEGAPQPFGGVAEMAGYAWDYRLIGKGAAQIEQSGGAQTLRVLATGRMPDSADELRAELRLADLAFSSSSQLGARAIDVTGQAQITHGPIALDLRSGGEGAQAQASASALEVGLGTERFFFDWSLEDAGLSVQSPRSPLGPLAFSAARLALGLDTPVGRSAAPEPFSMRTRLEGLTLDPMIWGTLDPAGALPRDPLTVVLDLAGQARLFVDLIGINPEKPLRQGMGELHALDLRALELAGGGAQLTGEGGFTFDNSDTRTFPGFPRPQGRIGLELVGGNRLIDALVAMGVLQPDQAMGARMMLGLFARPGGAPDTLVSEVEISPNGEILANGQRLQ